MTTPEEDLIPLGHMLEASGWALTIEAGHSLRDIEQRLELFLALVKAVEIVGEAASRVSEATRSRAPDIPWRRIIGMRIHLVHRYHDINLDTLWGVVTMYLTPLMESLRLLLPNDFTPIPLR